MTPLQGLIQDSVSRFPTKIAIRWEEVRVSYQELDREVRRVAGGLKNAGVKPGDRIAWLLPNCLEAVTVTMACYQIGAVAVPMNYRYVDREALDVIDRVDAQFLVFHQSKQALVESLLKEKPNLATYRVGQPGNAAAHPQIVSFDSLIADSPLAEVVEVKLHDACLILFTSGSTGHPKGVVHSHGGAFAGIDSSRQIFDFTEDDVVLVGKPISHAGGLQTQLMPALHVGAKTVLAMKPSATQAVSMINEYQVTQYGLLASDLLDFIEYLENNPTPIPSLKNSIGSGDSVPADLHHRFRDLLGWEVMEGSGMTEIGSYYAVNPRYGQRKWGSLGLPVTGTTLRVVDADGHDCGVGQTGEILVQSPAATIGYWHDSKATESLFKGGWLHSGDLARFDEDGYVWFVGRSKLMIVRRGSNIAPAEVETVIDEHASVHASVVVGLADSEDGQVPVACVALLGAREDSSEESIRAYVAEHLAAYKNPKHYLFLDEIPRTSTGKFDRHHLKDLVASTYSSN
ncbi:MAG: class I adenylate-forming enzyme family protein [Rubripirellula sp.]